MIFKQPEQFDGPTWRWMLSIWVFLSGLGTFLCVMGFLIALGVTGYSALNITTMSRTNPHALSQMLLVDVLMLPFILVWAFLFFSS